MKTKQQISISIKTIAFILSVFLLQKTREKVEDSKIATNFLEVVVSKAVKRHTATLHLFRKSIGETRLDSAFQEKYSCPFNTKYGDRRMSLKILTEACEFEWNFRKGSYDLSMGLDFGIETVIATGNELKLIRKLFDNLLVSKSQESVVWYGETAKFIVSNLLRMTAQFEVFRRGENFVVTKSEILGNDRRILAECSTYEDAENIRKLLREDEERLRITD